MRKSFGRKCEQATGWQLFLEQLINMHESNNTIYWPVRLLVIVMHLHTFQDQAACRSDFFAGPPHPPIYLFLWPAACSLFIFSALCQMNHFTLTSTYIHLGKTTPKHCFCVPQKIMSVSQERPKILLFIHCRLKKGKRSTLDFRIWKMMMMNWCLMSSDVMRHIRDKLWPMPKHGSINLYVHENQKAR